LLLLSVNDLSAGRVDTTRLVSHGFVILGWLIVVALSRVARDFALPPGERMAGGNGWHFVEDEQVPEPILPKLRLVPRGPLSAAATMPLSAAATMPSKRAMALGKQAVAPGRRAAAPGREAAALGKQTTMPARQAAVPGKVPLDWDAAVARRRAALPEQQATRAA
jgi:hypothetical protein